MKGDFNSTLIKQVSGTNKEAYDACTALASDESTIRIW